MTNSYNLAQLWKDLKIPVPINDARGLAVELTKKLTDTASTSSAYEVAESKNDAFTMLRIDPPFINGKANRENVVPVLKAIYGNDSSVLGFLPTAETITNDELVKVATLVADFVKKQQNDLEHTPGNLDAMMDIGSKICVTAHLVSQIYTPFKKLQARHSEITEEFNELRVVEEEIAAMQAKKAAILEKYKGKAAKQEPVEDAPVTPSTKILYTHLLTARPGVVAPFLAGMRSITQRFYSHVWTILTAINKPVVNSPAFPGIQSYAVRELMDIFFAEQEMHLGFYSAKCNIEKVSKTVVPFLTYHTANPSELIRIVAHIQATIPFEGFVDLPEHIRQFGMSKLPEHPIDFRKSRFFPQFKDSPLIESWEPASVGAWEIFFERFGSDASKDKELVITFQRSVFAKEMGRLFLQIPSYS